MTHPRTPATGRGAARALVLAAAVVVLAAVGTLTAAPARADEEGAVVQRHNQFCDPSLSTTSDMVVRAGGGAPQVGQDFQLVLTVVGRNQCLNGQTASMNVRLPAGVTLSPSGQSRCVTFASSNVAGTTQVVPCASSTAEDGYLRIDPQGAGTWSLARIGTGRNAAQVRLVVRASTSGARTAFGRVCDSGSSVICEGSPAADALPFVAFTVAPAAVTPPPPPPPPPPASVTADRLGIRKVATFCSSQPCPDLATTSTSIRVQAFLTGTRPAGTWQIQRRGPGAASFTTIATKTVTAGSGGPQSTLMTVATGLQASTTYRFRPCFTPTGGTRVCGAEIQLTTKPA